jgi:hypothetical protein
MANKGRQLRGMLARRLAKRYPGIISREQAREVLAAVDGNWRHAEWCCETIKLAQPAFEGDKLDPVQMAKTLAKRQGWEPKL